MLSNSASDPESAPPLEVLIMTPKFSSDKQMAVDSIYQVQPRSYFCASSFLIASIAPSERKQSSLLMAIATTESVSVRWDEQLTAFIALFVSQRRKIE